MVISTYPIEKGALNRTRLSCGVAVAFFCSFTYNYSVTNFLHPFALLTAPWYVHNLAS